MTFRDGMIPASIDMVELWPADDGSGVRLQCLICDASLGIVKHLNQAIRMWSQHQEEFMPFNPENPDRHTFTVSNA